MKKLLITSLALIVILGLGLWSLSVVGPRRARESGDLNSNPDIASSGKMVTLLHEIAQRRFEEQPYCRTDKAQELREQLASLGPQAPSHARWELLTQLATWELRLGDTEASIEHQLEAYQLLPEAEKVKYAGNNMRFNLGAAYLRLGETQNCCLRHTPDSCIVPIQGSGLHTKEEGSRKAIQFFTQVVDHGVKVKKDAPLFFSAKWLLNIAYMTLGAYPEEVPKQHLIAPSTFESRIKFPRFKNIAPELGLDTFNLSGSVIVDDFNNDDHLDIVSSTSDSAGQLRLFVNTRDGAFSEQTESAGLLGLYGGLNLVSADYNNDGWLDIFVLRGAWLFDVGAHPNSLLRNNGNGTFTDVTFKAGLGEVHYPTQTAAWADYDLDGDLDLFVGNESGGTRYLYTSDGTLDKDGPSDSKAQVRPSQLFRNNSDGTFTDVAQGAGVNHPLFVKATAWGDYNKDRFPDLYVSTLDGSNNRLYRNNGDGTFTDVAEAAGVTVPKSGFGAWFWDFDNDGNLDLFAASYKGAVAHYAAAQLGIRSNFEPPALYKGDGHGGFKEVAAEQGLNHPMLTMGANFGDLNNDGFLDFYLGTGNPSYQTLVPNMMFLNQSGNGFENVTMAGGFGHLQKGHGIAFADLDNDGDLDVFEQMGGAFPGDAYGDALFKNPGFSNHWLSVKLVGVQSNRSAIGASIHARFTEDAGQRSVYRDVNSGGSFGCNPLRQTIGMGKATQVDSLEIFWPRTGRTQRFENLNADQWIVITEGQKTYKTLQLKQLQLGS